MKKCGFTDSERALVVRQCEVIAEQIHVLLNQVSGRIYARHLDRLCRIGNDFPFFADEFKNGYPTIDESEAQQCVRSRKRKAHGV